jgi:hypothetical protein
VLVLLTWVLLAIPYFFKFTIYVGDMFKFFYFAIIPAVVLFFWLLAKTPFKAIRILLTVVITGLSVTTSLLTLGGSYFNKNEGYTRDDLEVGMWIRANTPEKSVFIGMPTLHTPISQIGGRLRVLSYINWPYTHGYNTGADNVFKRRDDIEKVYGLGSASDTIKIINSYNAKYILLGPEERHNFPESETKLDQLSFLKKVFVTDKTTIYEVN